MYNETILEEQLRRIADALDRAFPKPSEPDPDPWHDQGNGTNHRLSQCTQECHND